MSLDATHGTSAGALTFPQGITYDAGELFVCDCEEHTIFVYDALTLQFKRSFGGPGDAEGELELSLRVRRRRPRGHRRRRGQPSGPRARV